LNIFLMINGLNRERASSGGFHKKAPEFSPAGACMMHFQTPTGRFSIGVISLKGGLW